MGMPNNGYGLAFGDQARSQDALERFFSGWESAFCAPRSIEALSNEVVVEPDVLDYVFEHVESFSCADESLMNDPFYHRTSPNRPQKGFMDGPTDSFDLSLKRENSLVEQGPNGAPVYVATPTGRAISRFGEEGDLLDYCFEHVESYVCTDAREVENDYSRGKGSSRNGSSKNRQPMRNTTNNHRRRRHTAPETYHPIPREISTSRRERKKKRRQRKQNYYPDEEDNILLYYRPNKDC